MILKYVDLKLEPATTPTNLNKHEAIRYIIYVHVYIIYIHQKLNGTLPTDPQVSC